MVMDVACSSSSHTSSGACRQVPPTVRCERTEVMRDVAALASSLKRAFLRQGSDSIREAMSERYTWASEFRDDELELFAEEMYRLVLSAADSCGYVELVRAEAAWRETALALADGARRNDELDWLPSPKPVPRP